LAAAVLGLLVGCGSPREQKVHEVVMHDMKFEPAELTVAVGDKIVWKNDDFVVHTVTAANRFDSGNVVGVASWSITLAAVGDISYACTLHPMMLGKIRVR
jgi:plastocyanin